MPTPSKLSKSCSDFKALLPDKSIADIVGLSMTLIIKVFPSFAIWISSNCSVEKSDLTISVDFR